MNGNKDRNTGRNLGIYLEIDPFSVSLMSCLVSFSHVFALLHGPYSLPILTALFSLPMLHIFTHNSASSQLLQHPFCSTLVLLFYWYLLVHTSQRQSESLFVCACELSVLYSFLILDELAVAGGRYKT